MSAILLIENFGNVGCERKSAWIASEARVVTENLWCGDNWGKNLYKSRQDIVTFRIIDRSPPEGTPLAQLVLRRMSKAGTDVATCCQLAPYTLTTRVASEKNISELKVMDCSAMRALFPPQVQNEWVTIQVLVHGWCLVSKEEECILMCSSGSNLQYRWASSSLSKGWFMGKQA
ncbi:hypothetical protein ARMSODRAFT_979153 [Armillaria solidipes]|uniref:Uncharacterized protein n=1 Tax=Armillaria solidipes TaxID=1076256 RepID=A0A2H3BE46_9AGAR|nr:hypothetical protein ARMSODRAFT_979153 [Armillaria solidipes]